MTRRLVYYNSPPIDGTGIIYMIVEPSTGRRYVGATTKSLGKRISLHRSGHRINIDYDNVICGEIERVNRDILFEREAFWIDYYNCYDNGFNHYAAGQSKWRLVYDDGNVVEVNNLKKYCLKNGLNRGCLLRLCKRLPNQQSHRGIIEVSKLEVLNAF